MKGSKGLTFFQSANISAVRVYRLPAYLNVNMILADMIGLNTLDHIARRANSISRCTTKLA